MSRNIICTAKATIDCDLDVDISLLSSRIFTTTEKKDDNEDNSDGKRFLYINIEQTLEQYESLTDGLAHIRPRKLILLGILSFLTQKPFTSFEFQEQKSSFGVLELSDVERFSYEKENFYHL